MGMPRRYPDRATKQWAYRRRLEEKCEAQKEIELAIKDLVAVGVDQGIVFDYMDLLWQLRELRLWLLRNGGRNASMGNVTLEMTIPEL
jgi:hypothetical protein